MTTEYRTLRPEDIEQAAHVEAAAFYNESPAEWVETLRKFFPPEWTAAAFVDGRLVADVRSIPIARRINGAAMLFGAVGPVACVSTHRRQGHVAKLLRMTMERLREQGVALCGLHTPHDALYARYGWERAEGARRYIFEPKDVKLRIRGARGSLRQVSPDEWQKLDEVYRAWAAPRNGPLVRVEPWWREAVLRIHEPSGRKECEAIIWHDAAGSDQGYVVYAVRSVPREAPHLHREIVVREFVALTADAYLGLWENLLTHDLASRIVAEAPLDDPFPELAVDPWKVAVERAEGAMIRVIDVEKAINARPFCVGHGATFTMGITDATLPWNEGVWRVEASAGQMRAERTDAAPDFELSINTLAPLFTGHMRPDVAAGVGLLKVNRTEALDGMTRVFTVTHAPFCADMY